MTNAILSTFRWNLPSATLYFTIDYQLSLAWLLMISACTDPGLHLFSTSACSSVYNSGLNSDYASTKVIMLSLIISFTDPACLTSLVIYLLPRQALLITCRSLLNICLLLNQSLLIILLLSNQSFLMFCLLPGLTLLTYLPVPAGGNNYEVLVPLCALAPLVHFTRGPELRMWQDCMRSLERVSKGTCCLPWMGKQPQACLEHYWCSTLQMYWTWS